MPWTENCAMEEWDIRDAGRTTCVLEDEQSCKKKLLLRTVFSRCRVVKFA